MWVKLCSTFQLPALGKIAVYTWYLIRYPIVKTLCADPIRLPKRVADATWGLLLWIADGGDCRESSNGPLCLKTKRGPWWRPRRSMRDGFVQFCAFHGSSCPRYTSGQTGRAIYIAMFAKAGGTTGRRCWRHVCVEEALHCAHCMSRYAILLHLKGIGHVLRNHLYFLDSGGECYGPSAS